MDAAKIGEETEQKQIVIQTKDKNGKRILKPISVPNWLLDVLKWINRMEMANSSLSFSCKLFRQLCWLKLHGDVKAHNVKHQFLGFCHEMDEFGNPRAVLRRYENSEQMRLRKWKEAEIIPIACGQVPGYILRFQHIHIWFLDSQVMEFVKNAANNADKISIKITTKTAEMNENEIMELRRLIASFAAKIFHLDFVIADKQSAIRLIPAEILYKAQSMELFGKEQWESDFAFNWLIKRRSNKKHKILELFLFEQNQPFFINRVKEEFIGSSTPNSFIINLRSIAMNFDHRPNYADFTMENEQTGEVLTLYHKNITQNSQVHLIRYPKVDEYWTKYWENETFEETTKIFVDIQKFGNLANEFKRKDNY